MSRFPRRPWFLGCALGLAFAGAALLPLSPSPAAEEEKSAEPAPAPPAAPKKKSTARPTTSQLLALINEQKALIEEQHRVIADLQARFDAQQGSSEEQNAAIQAQTARLAELEGQITALNQRIDELMAQIPGVADQQALEARLKRIEEASAKVPELPPDMVSAGDFPGSIRIPGTDTAFKFGGRIRAAAVFTLDSLGSDDRFLTNSIPITDADEAAGKGSRTSFTANTSRFNFEVRTPAGATQMRAFIEGDFFGEDGSGERTAFRLRHAYAQFKGVVVGQTWSTFSDPAANHQDLDFEGINGENLIRQPQVRYTWLLRDNLSLAAAAETPEVSLTGGEGVNLIPDLIGRVIWKFKEIGHLQGAVAYREIRGESDLEPDEVRSVNGWGASLSGVVPFHYFNLTDRFIFQINTGKGNARYINDLNSLGGQDAVFNPVTGDLEALPADGFYLDYEHQWKEWQMTREMKLRSSVIWSYVQVDNLDFQLPEAYHRTNRFSVNLVFSPIDRIDVGIEYITGNRENKDGERGTADQIQAVGIFRF